MKGFSTLDKKGRVKENYFYADNFKEYLCMNELKKLAYELTPVLRKRKEDLKIYSFSLEAGSVLQIGFRHLCNSDYEIFVLAHIPASIKGMFNLV